MEGTALGIKGYGFSSFLVTNRFLIHRIVPNVVRCLIKVQNCVTVRSYLLGYSYSSWGFILIPFLPISCFPDGSDCKESACNVRRPHFKAWVGTIPWRREWLPTSVFLPGKCRGQRSLMGYSPWDLKDLDKTERLTLSLSYFLAGSGGVAIE